MTKECPKCGKRPAHWELGDVCPVCSVSYIESNSKPTMLNITLWAKINYALAIFFSSLITCMFLIYSQLNGILALFMFNEELLAIFRTVAPVIISALFAVIGWRKCNLAHQKCIKENLCLKYETSLMLIVIGNLFMLITVSVVVYMSNGLTGSASGIALAPTLFLALLFYISVINLCKIIKIAIEAPNKANSTDGKKRRR